MKVSAEKVLSECLEARQPRSCLKVPMPMHDDVMMSLSETCVFFGGPDRPIHYSTLYRGIAAGRYPEGVRVGPNSVRWLRSECREARQKLIEARKQPEIA